ncbi:MAG: DUF4125 family protein [Lachnospiraceae bacterium]|nr:DUF4125 family protein [Lachnospiraceae bacterium]
MDNLTEQIDRLFAENRGAEAEKLLEQALAEAYENQYFLDAVPILNELIGYCRETSQVERSYSYAEEVQEILQNLGLEGSLHHGTTLLNIANAYRAGGRLEDSLEKYGQVAEIYKELLAEDDMLWASLHNNSSLLYQEMGRFDLAKEALLKALEIVVKKKDTIFEQAVTYTNLANTCLQLGQGEEAKQYFTGAILLFEKYDIRDTHYCAALSSLGTYYFQKKEYEMAQEYFVKAMEGIEAHLGRNEYYYRMQENAGLCRELGALQRGAQDITDKKAGTPNEGLDPQEDFVNGLTLSKEYYETYGKPMIESRFPKYADRIAVGLVGEGSDCFGFDDALSMDHDWGPSFCMWVSDETYVEIGEELQEAYEALPKEYKGYVYKESPQGQGRRGVLRISDFYEGLLGKENCPKDWEAFSGVHQENTDADEQHSNLHWADISKHRLAAAVNGEVFRDEEGTFTAIRNQLKTGYPERLCYLEIAEGVAKFSQDLQYNYGRMLKRGNKATAQMILSDGIKEALKLLYLIAGDYAPHDKWLWAGLRKKPAYSEVLALLEKLLLESAADKEAQIETIGEKMAYILYGADIISDVNPFLQEHVSELLYKAGCVEKTKEELAEQIARQEFQAFDKVKNQGGRADCQDDWFTFSIMRKSQYLTWNRTMLLQYAYDFDRELSRGHNLIEEKYGRMEESTAPSEYEKIKDHFPVISPQKKQIIEEVVVLQVKWMEEFAKEYPKLAGNARSIHTYEDHLWNTSYETYLRGELSTYSDKMLELYAKYIVEYARVGKNPARDIMEESVWLYGYEGLDEAEAGL